VNTWHKPAHTPQLPRTFTLCGNSAHRYQNKGFINQNSEILSPLFSHTSAHLRLQPRCFDTLHKNTRGQKGTLSPTIPSRIGMTEKHGRRNPRTGLPGEEPGRTHRGRPATTLEGERPASEGAPYMRKKKAATMYRAPTQKKAGRANREIHPAEPAGWRGVGVPRGAGRALRRGYTFSRRATK